MKEDNKILIKAGLIAVSLMMIQCSSMLKIKSERSESGKIITFKSFVSNVYLIKTDSSKYIMIDAGMHEQEEYLLKALAENKVDLKDISLIIVTHGHADHYGTLGHLKNFSNAKVLSHKEAAYFLETGGSREPVARTFSGSILALMHPAHEADKVIPDITIEKEYSLDNFGIKGTVILTPGHTPDSISVLLQSGELFIGDMFIVSDDEIDLGKFCENEKEAIQSIKRLTGLEFNTIYISHGNTIRKESFIKMLKNSDLLK
ncbi:MAG: MBL fold metallo-hydrolase [Spirochaetia bacterium]|nr:MBL fold metallo-hydrolase [Spirochaetia bacterium]